MPVAVPGAMLDGASAGAGARTVTVAPPGAVENVSDTVVESVPDNVVDESVDDRVDDEPIDGRLVDPVRTLAVIVLASDVVIPAAAKRSAGAAAWNVSPVGFAHWRISSVALQHAQRSKVGSKTTSRTERPPTFRTSGNR